MGGSNLEEDGCFLVGDRRLCRDLVCERIVPGEIDTNLRKA